MVNPLNAVLIRMEHYGSVEKENILEWGKNESRGIIGKMEAMGLVLKDGGRYSLSKKGYEYINNILDNLHLSITHWDGIWRFISFSIPEKSRPKRDRFRRYLESIGFKPLFSSIWISPTDKKDMLSTYIKKNCLEDNAILIESNTIIYNEIKMLEVWDLESIKNKYISFIEESELLLKQKDKYKLKLAIFEFASIISDDPKLPIEFLPKDWPFYRAKQMYKRLRSAIG